MLRVLMPAWWGDQGKQHIGLTDGMDTYCCSSVPCWFVEVPDCGYSGYFRKSDLTIIRLIQVRESLDARLPELWDIVDDAEFVEKHSSLWNTFRWYRIYYAPSRQSRMEKTVNAMR